MKKNVIIVLAVLAVSAAAIITLCSFTSASVVSVHTEADAHTHAPCEGKRCTYTVGCDCSGFSPITNGKEWEKAYCRRCRHHRSYHR